VNNLIEAIFTGLLQGLLEWLPLSSEGNIVFFLFTFFGYSKTETLNTAIFLHLGTGLAALLYFRKEIIKILLAETKEYDDIRSKIILMTFLTGLVGFPIYMWLNISIVYGEFLLAITGLALIFSGLLQRYSANRRQIRSELTWPLSLILGLAQGLSVIPGVSRSGLTTSILLLSDFTGEEAFRVSFLMSIPTSFSAAIGLMIIKGYDLNFFSAFSALVASLFGYFTIDALLRLAREVSFWKICIGIGTLAILAWVPNIV
jgi:undecaprenyl-diphosphatase